MDEVIFFKVLRFGEVINAFVQREYDFSDWTIEYISLPLYPFKKPIVNNYFTFDKFCYVSDFLKSQGFYLKHCEHDSVYSHSDPDFDYDPFFDDMPF